MNGLSTNRSSTGVNNNNVAGQKTARASRGDNPAAQADQRPAEPSTAFSSLVNFLLQPQDQGFGAGDWNGTSSSPAGNGGANDGETPGGSSSAASNLILQTASPAQIADALIQSMLGGSTGNCGPLRSFTGTASRDPAASPSTPRIKSKPSASAAPGLDLAALLNLSASGLASAGPGSPPPANLKAQSDGSDGSGSAVAANAVAANDGGVQAAPSGSVPATAGELAAATAGELAFGALLTPRSANGPPSFTRPVGAGPADAQGTILRAAPAGNTGDASQNSSANSHSQAGSSSGEASQSEPARKASSADSLPATAGAGALVHLAAQVHTSSSESALSGSSVQVETTSAAAIAEPAATAPSSARIHDLTVRINPPDAAPVDLQVSQRSGELHVAVRTSDGLLQTALRQNLPHLVESLDQAGFHAETFLPHNSLSEANSGLNALAQAAGASGFSHHSENGPGQNPAQDHRQDNGQAAGQRQDGFNGSNSQQQERQRQSHQQQQQPQIQASPPRSWLPPRDWIAHSLSVQSQ